MFRFDSVTLHNFRQYQDIILEFPQNTGCDIHVLIASNGIGKTSLLNSLNWCLYADEPHTSGGQKTTDSRDDVLPVCNTVALVNAKNAGEASVPVSINICASEGAYTYEFYRERYFDPVTFMQKGADLFRVTETLPDGSTQIHENENANDIVEMIMPRNIRQYFFFDSDQLIDYVDVGPDKENNLRKSIYAISGVNAVQGAIERLNTIENETRRKLKSLDPQLEAKTNAVATAKEAIDSTRRQIEDCKEQISISERGIEEANAFIDGQESVVEDNRKFTSNQALIQDLENKKREIQKEVQLFVRKYVTLLALYPINKRTSEYIAERQSMDNLKTNINVEAIEDSLAHHECRLCTQNIPHDIEDDLRLLVQKYKANASLQLLSRISNDITRSLGINSYLDEKEALFKKLDDCEAQIQALEDENAKLTERIKRSAGIEDISFYIEQRDLHTKVLEDNKYKKRRLEEQLPQLEKAYSDKQHELEDAMNDDEESKQLKERLRFLAAALKYSDRIQEEIVNGIKIQMQEHAMELFLQLVWKRDTYDHIELDDAFKIKLFDKLTKRSCFGSASAGEKQLMALAFTIALHEVSGYDNLLFIDTPVGRLSDDNRRNFAKALLNISKKKQLILVFTSSEFSEEVSSILTNDVISSKRVLTTDETERNTFVKGEL